MFVNSNANISNASKDQVFATSESVGGGGKLEQKTKKKPTNPEKQAFFEELRKSKPPTAQERMAKQRAADQ